MSLILEFIFVSHIFFSRTQEERVERMADAGNAYLFKVFGARGQLLRTIDASDPARSSWARYINAVDESFTELNQNVQFVQSNKGDRVEGLTLEVEDDEPAVVLTVDSISPISELLIKYKQED